MGLKQDLINAKVEATKASGELFIEDQLDTSVGSQIEVEAELTKEAIVDFLTKADSDGMTAREKAHKESSTEIKLAIDYLMYKGFNLKDIIATKAKTASAKSLRKKIKSNATTKSASRPKRKGGFDIESLDLNLSNL